MHEAFQEVTVTTGTREETRPQVKRQPPYAVILHNDPVNGFDFVIESLQRVFGYGKPKAFRLTLTAHFRGRSAVWVGALEVAEFKAERLQACGPDPRQTSAGALPLRVSIEPVPV